MNNVQSEESAQFGNNNDSNKNNNINNTEYQKNFFLHTQNIEKEKISIISFLYANYVIDVTRKSVYHFYIAMISYNRNVRA